MSQTCTFDEAISLAHQTMNIAHTGPIPRARLWNMLSTRVRNGQDITDFTTMALVASVVGKSEAASFVAAVQSVWATPATGG